MKLTNNDSFINYLWDNFIKSFENKESLIEATVDFTIDKKTDFLKQVYTNLDNWEDIYNNRYNKIASNVQLGNERASQNISFHPKFGWSIESCGKKAYLGKSSIFDNIKINIGNRTYISGHGTIRGNGVLNIGNYCSIADGLYINVSNENHALNYAASIGMKFESRMIHDNFLQEFKFEYHKKELHPFINIGSDVWIGKNVSVISGVTISNGCAIGAKSLVTKSCEPYGVYAGTPAKLIRYRFPKQIIEKLLKIEWWNWDEQKMIRNEVFFNTDLTTFNGDLMKVIIE